MAIKKEYKWYFLGLVIIVLYFLPFLILGEESIIFIHDNLEISFIQRIILARNGLPFSPTFLIEEVMNGLPRAYYPSSLSLINVFFYVLPPFEAYIFNEFFVRLIGYTGMYLLLDEHLIKDGAYKKYIVIIGGISFAFIQFYSIQGLTIAGQPLLAYAFLNLLKEKKSQLSYTLICFYAFYSYFVYSTIFILFMLLLYMAYIHIKTKKIPKTYLKGLLLLCIVSLLVEYNLVIQLLNNKYISNRSDFVVPILSITEIKNLVYGKYITPYHSGAFDPIWAILTFCLAIIICNRTPKKTQVILFSILTVFCSIFVATYIKQFAVSIGFEFVKGVDVTRFSFLLPFFWTILLVVSLSRVVGNKYIRGIIPIILFLHLSGILKGSAQTDHYLPNWKKILGREQKSTVTPELNYSSFFAPDLFDDIGGFIGKDKSSYRIVSVGINPCIAQYNGFYTLDSYENSYPLEYKRDFRRIIGKEIHKAGKIEKYYDNWGCRCYILPVELDRRYIFDKNSKKEIMHLDINVDELKKMKGEYVISSVRIANAESNQMKLEKIFENNTSYWKIFLYSLK
ncbi:DUF6044 family protein [Flagellimonas baculiformis]|uniref:DUF6044 family protein n=1 Tax=Flagellimonas baculiformis TaxID=3067310 RepID=UPI00296F0A66|nr:DUF6044 family protein [Muricauda sp. D6]